MARARFGLIFAVALWLASPLSHAVIAPSPPLPQPSWAQLNAEQKRVLAPLAGEWDKMDGFRRKKWLGIAQRYPSLSPDEQARMQRRMTDWAKLTPDERKRAREKYQSLQKAPPEKKEAGLMGRCLTSVCVLCRREHVKLFLKGNRCFTSKCAIEQKRPAPGQHGAEFKKMSDYGTQLREKQKLRRYYLMMERPFLRQFGRSFRTKGKTGEIFLRLLELRLDNVVFRMGLAPSRGDCTQYIA